MLKINTKLKTWPLASWGRLYRNLLDEEDYWWGEYRRYSGIEPAYEGFVGMTAGDSADLCWRRTQWCSAAIKRGMAIAPNDPELENPS